MKHRCVMNRLLTLHLLSFKQFLFFSLSTPSMLTHTNLNHLFSFSPYLYSRKKNTKIVKSQNDKTTKNPHSRTTTKLGHPPHFSNPSPPISQSRHLKGAWSTVKTTTSSIQKNQEKNISHLRRLSISQVRHLKTGSLIICPPERISQSRRLHHFPHSAPLVSQTRRFAFFVFVVLPIKK